MRLSVARSPLTGVLSAAAALPLGGAGRRLFRSGLRRAVGVLTAGS